MVHLNKDFKVIDKNKYIMWSVIGFIFLGSVAGFIVSSWWKYDLNMSVIFNKGMDIDFIKGWAAYSVTDGYVLIITYGMVLLFIVIESIYAYFKKTTNHGMKPWNPVSLKVLYGVGLTLYSLGMFYELYTMTIQDEGFGMGFNYWYIIGWSYVIPIVVVSMVINMTICFSLCWYVHNVLAKRPDFLEYGYWKKAFAAALLVAMLYLPMHFIKGDTGRPYLYNIRWHEYLDKINVFDHSRYEHYINQDVFNYGWNDFSGRNDLSFPDYAQDWPWWKLAKSEYHKTQFGKNLPFGDAFPSGHMCECAILIATMQVVFGNPRNEKERKIQLAVFFYTIVIDLNMYFALEVSLTHWLSDMAFSMTWAPIAWPISLWVIEWITKKEHMTWVPNWVRRIKYPVKKK